MIGFETIGNATIVAFDGEPVLATDPWITGSAYFGSWGLSYEVPPAQLESIRKSRYIWFSHGHPDHLNSDSLSQLSDRTVLLPDHAGGRIYKDLVAQNLRVRILPDRRWIQLSRNVKVMCIADFFQDAVLLIDTKGTLLINTNDALNHGWQRLVQSVARNYKIKFLLKLSGYGDADMINMFAEDGVRITPAAAQKKPPAIATEAYARLYGATHFVPFSSFHRYQREDSLWAEQYTTPLTAYADGATGTDIEFLPAFIRYDVERHRVTTIEPPPTRRVVFPPSEFGDNWSDVLSSKDVEEVRQYFLCKKLLANHIGFIRLRVGAQETTIDLNKSKFKTAITFEVPRTSLMTAIRYQVFDDLLIGNFMKTTLHGLDSLYPHFSPVVPKYADNGGANTRYELAKYFLNYTLRAPGEMLRYHFWEQSEAVFRRLVDPDSRLFALSKRVYHSFKHA